MNNTVKKLVLSAMFAAMAFATAAIFGAFPFFKVQFLSFEIKDIFIVFCSLICGPIFGLAVSVLVPVLEFLTISGTGLYGLIMNILSSATFALVTGMIYKYHRTFFGAIIGLLSGVFSVTAVMTLANLVITPLFMGVPRQVILDQYLLVLILPFNLLKTTVNAGFVLLLYKPLRQILKRTGLLRTGILPKSAIVSENGAATASPAVPSIARTIVTSIVSALVILTSLAIIFFVLK